MAQLPGCFPQAVLYTFPFCIHPSKYQLTPYKMSTVAISKKTKIEDEKVDVEALTSDEEDAHVHDENCSHGHGGRTIGRKERAARKEISKAATLKAMPKIKRVTFKRHNGPVFAISNAEVFYDTTSGAYIIYGQPMVESNGLSAHASAAQRMAAEKAAAGINDSLTGNSNITVEDDETSASGNKYNDNEEEVDASGLDEKDISIVMDQANVSRSKAIKALRANNNDIVNTIMELTM
jgi:nascent polypeptide-associated complex subunit alpha